MSNPDRIDRQSLESLYAAIIRPEPRERCARPPRHRVRWRPHRLWLLAVVALVAMAPGCKPEPQRIATVGPTVLVGDSITWQAANPLRFFYAAAHPGQQLTIRAMGGTAPCDWLPTIRTELAAKQKPRQLALEFYGNSLTGCMGAPGDGSIGYPVGSPAFLKAYGTALDQIAAAARAARVPVLWVTGPVRPGTDPAPGLNATLNSMAAARGWKVLNAERSVATSKGTWARALPCATWETNQTACHGGLIAVRDSSRIHFAFTGPDRTGYSAGAFRWATAVAAGLA